MALRSLQTVHERSLVYRLESLSEDMVEEGFETSFMVISDSKDGLA